MRTGQLVVRYHSFWRRRTVWVAAALGAVLLLYVAFELGRFAGGYSKFAEIQQRRELKTDLRQLEQENEKLRAQLAAVELARNVDDKAYANVERDLADLQGQLLKQREELTFYQGIVSPEDGIGALRIQRFEILPTDTEGGFLLRMVLVRSMRQDTGTLVSGSMKLQIEGTRGSEPVTLELADLSGTARPGSALPFKFRYFQNIEQDIGLPVGFEPRTVHVEVGIAKQAPVRESYPWQVQIEQ